MAKLSSDVRKEENARLLEENQQLRQMVEERNAELTIIQSVQEGLTSGLDVQAIYDLVGDKIREIFNADATFIAFKDVEQKVLRTVYYADKEKKLTFDRLYGYGLAEVIFESGRPIMIKTAEERTKYPIFEVASPGAQKDLNTSILGCPITINGRIVGVISVQDYAEYAFDENDQRLLITLANSMSVALENARLFNETQRLLRETEQRAAELVIINSVQEGLASKLDVQAIYDLVGDKIRDIFQAQGTAIYLFDHKTEILETPYCFLKKRFEIESRPFSDHPIAKLMINTLQPLTYRNVEEYRALGGAVLENSEEYKSGMYVPLMVGREIKGMVGIANLDKEDAYDDSDLRLLQTLANSMSVALENARLFDETQRLLKETEQRAAELAIINSVQEGLASKMDMQAIYDLVGDKIRDLFSAQSIWIVMFDQDTRTRQFKYSFEKGRRLYIPEALPFNKLTEHLIATKKTLVINQDADARIAEFEMSTIGDSETSKSAVFVPLIAGGAAKGFITLQNVEQENAFSESDINLLSTLASSMSVALENARLFEETQRLFRLEQQRAAELAIINSVQSALAENLDIQAIYDIVGNKIQDVFNAQTVILMSYGETVSTVHYYVEKGERFYDEPIALSELHKTLIRTGKSLVFNENTYEELLQLGCVLTPGSEAPRSAVFVPLMIGNRVFGVISLQNVDQEHAFAEADVRLLETLASSMSVALENARLFDETQRLLRETEQRNAELAIINSVQQGLAEGVASKRDIQAIYDLVGNKIRELFPNTDTEIRVYDPKMNLIHFPYFIDDGQRVTVDPIPLTDSGISSHLLRTGQTLVINENFLQEAERFGSTPILLEGGHLAKSGVFVPWMVNNQARGLLVLSNVEREHAFSNSDVRLFQTLVNGMSTALESARLFDETQRLLKETEQRNVELAIINSVQQGLASKLDMQAIYDLVGDKIRELLNAESVWIITFDPATRTRRVRYSFENGQRYHTSESFPYNKLTEHLITTKKPLVINQNFTEAIARFEMINMAGTQEQIKSIVYIPIMAGEDVNGFISLPNIERENAFSESDVNLLSTFAFAMSIALENIRLFDETRRLFLEAKEAHTAAEQANQAKSAFLSSMSHELRTPLNAIINFVEMVARGMIGPVNQEQVEILDQALHSSKHLLNLINDVLDISKIQAGQLTLFIEDQVSVQVEVESTLSIAGGLLQEKGLQLIRDIDPHLPMISCDRRRLRQVLLNLISNAIKFTNEGTVTVSVKHQGQEVLFAVIDTGPGIPPDKQDLIFEPFLQAENGERQMHGTGLGLPISRSLVRAHGGELWVDSERGEGSAFFFTLPVDRRSTP